MTVGGRLCVSRPRCVSFSLQRSASEPPQSAAERTESLNQLSGIAAKSWFESGLVLLSLAEHLRLCVFVCEWENERRREEKERAFRYWSKGPLQRSLEICIHIMLGNFLRRWALNKTCKLCLLSAELLWVTAQTLLHMLSVWGDNCLEQSVISDGGFVLSLMPGLLLRSMKDAWCGFVFLWKRDG